MRPVKFREWVVTLGVILFLAIFLAALIMSFFGGGLKEGEPGMIVLNIALGVIAP
jgi:hypothetical protein